MQLTLKQSKRWKNHILVSQDTDLLTATIQPRRLETSGKEHIRVMEDNINLAAQNLAHRQQMKASQVPMKPFKLPPKGTARVMMGKGRASEQSGHIEGGQIIKGRGRSKG